MQAFIKCRVDNPQPAMLSIHRPQLGGCRHGHLGTLPPCRTEWFLGTHETQVLGTRLGLFASIGQSTTRTQVMTRD